MIIDTSQWHPRRLYWAWVIRHWPWHIVRVRQLLTNPDITEIEVHLPGRQDILYSYTAGRKWYESIERREIT